MADEPELVVWFDPGKTTGWASYHFATETFCSGQVEDDNVALGAFLEVLGDISVTTAPECVAVGYELYLVVGGPRAGTSEHSEKAISVIEQTARRCGYTLLPPQPSSARKLGGPAMLRRMGWYRPGQRHANDGAMHLLADLMRMKPMPYAVRRKLFPGY